ncbi:phosphate signaling complex protein PhoU [Thiocystis violascens]|uniref:Phosphate-specific transport system accessory protein PhoU n=1 Tax=Thiocystis violascens (strain ATCC 17096 / DSM 198 / 6111) TaxID=765911 RepID=I3Y6H0_THIV6|nr:phosphate signaling complex protein PhoU [Thiocystis violascens]AFL72588.1 phosphate uptake regulator, PhoU [Thiocystis violascens DSM 198]
MNEMQLLVEKKRETLREGILAMGDLVSTALRASLDALRGQDLALASQIIEGDEIINRERRALEQEALVVLAAHQPAGRDLRLIGASMEMIAELERVADHAADVARILLRAEGQAFPADPVDHIAAMGQMAASMFSDVMQAYARNANAEQARIAVAREDEVDAQERETIQEIAGWICGNPQTSMAGIELLWIAHHYERVADRATNIAERIIYIATGETPELN